VFKKLPLSGQSASLRTLLRAAGKGDGSLRLCKREVKVAGRKKAPFPSLTADQAHTALRWLHELGRIRSQDIAAALRDGDRLVAQMKQRLEELDAEGALFAMDTAGLVRRPGTPRRRRKVSAKALAAWKAQGRYLAAMRRLSKADRAKVRAVRESKGVGAATEAARRIAKT
jgi:hypothetical protein